MKFVVLSSSRGTVLKAVLDCLKQGDVTAKCLGLVTDKKERGCVRLAKSYGIPLEIIEMQKDEPRSAYDKRLDAAITKLSGGQDVVIACMGWKWILSPEFVGRRKNTMINVHPSLLPRHPGAHAHDLVLAAKDTESGMTIHVIDDGVDTGKILLQKSCPVFPDDTVETLKARVQELECEWYPKVLQMIEEGEMKLP